MIGRFLRTTGILTAATALWLPCVNVFFPGIRPDGGKQIAASLEARQLDLWSSEAARRRAVEPMRSTNPEWDFMGRTFLVLALTNRAIASPDRGPALLDAVDRIIDDTLRLERAHGQHYFLMAYAGRAPFIHPSQRSLFVDGEVALMIASRQLASRAPRWDDELDRRIEIITRQMDDEAFAESYPNEAWTFCNTAALAAIRTADHVNGTNHDRLIEGWLRRAKQRLIDPSTGLLVSSFTVDGNVLDGPEGSSLWTAAHFLAFVDPEFARMQYDRTRQLLGETVLGFGYAREWPTRHAVRQDVDSGPIVPVLEASAGSSGQALVAAATFDDDDFLTALSASLELAAFPQTEGKGITYSAATQVGDAVLLYALSVGPALDRIHGRSGEDRS